MVELLAGIARLLGQARHVAQADSFGPAYEVDRERRLEGRLVEAREGPPCCCRLATNAESR
jgi:hypothetical protein